MSDRYNIIKLIGKDAAGGVYLAEDTRLNRKVIFRHIDAPDLDQRSESWREEFSNYSGKICALQHPNLVTIYDVTEDEDGVSIVTQFSQGELLAERLSSGPLRQVGVFNMAGDLLEAIHAIHEAGLYHGSLYAGSVKRLPRASGGHRYLIMDLGLNTVASMVKGEKIQIQDPILLAPELHDDPSQLDAKSDLFMLGHLCYTALAGGHPFAEYDVERCKKAHLEGELPHLSKFAPKAQKDFVDWIMGLCVGDRAKRPESSDEAMASYHEITLEESAPNVPGLTQAVEVSAPKLKTALVTASKPKASAPDRSKITTSITESSPSQPPTPKSKKGLIIAILSALIIVGLAVGLSRRSTDGDSPTSAQSKKGAKKMAETVRLGTPNFIKTAPENKKRPRIVFDPEKSLDWLIARGVPALSGTVDKKDGNYIKYPSAVGTFKEVFKGNRKKEAVARYQAGKKKVLPVAYVDQKGGLSDGDGWEVTIYPPKNHKGDLRVSFYLFYKNVDFEMEVKFQNRNTPEVFSVKTNGEGVVQIPIEFKNVKAGAFYQIKALVKPQNKKGEYKAGIHAVQVESL